MNRTIAIALAVVALLAGISLFAYRAGYNSAQSSHMKEREAEMLEYNKAVQEAQSKTAELQTQADGLKRSSDEKINKLNASVSVLNKQLRDRPARESAMPSTPGAEHNTASGCNGTQLYREDSEFLVGEAERAEKIRIALSQCLAQYNSLSAK